MLMDEVSTLGWAAEAAEQASDETVHVSSIMNGARGKWPRKSQEEKTWPKEMSESWDSDSGFKEGINTEADPNPKVLVFSYMWAFT